MCFSAEGSFVAAGVLAGVGGLSLYNVKSKAFIMFASIPLLFALQQFAEGIIWLTLSHKELSFIAYSAAIAFLAFALVLWPSWIPISLYQLENKGSFRKKIFITLIIYGALFSIASIYVLGFYPIDFYVVNSSIVYATGMQIPFELLTMLLIYAIPSVGSFFVSSHKSIWFFGSAVSLALTVTLYFKYLQLISVWCYLAAVLSIIILTILLWENKHRK
jgi:hypothetical protein